MSSQTQEWASIDAFSDFLSNVEPSLGADVDRQVRVGETLSFDLFDSEDLAIDGDDARLERLPFTTVSSFDDTAFTLTTGELPTAGSVDGAIEVLLSDELSEQIGVRAGQELVIVNPRTTPEDANWSRAIRVSGTWSVTNGDQRAAGRFFRTGAVQRSLLVPESTVEEAVSELDPEIVVSAQWLVLLDATSVTTRNVDSVVGRSNRLSREANEVLAGVRMSVNPGSFLGTYQADVSRLNNGLASFSLPTLVMLLAVVSLTVTMTWRTRRPELEMVRRRGLSARPLIAAGAIEAVVLTAAALLVGVALSMVVVRVIGQTSTFLRIGGGDDLAIRPNDRAIRSAVGVSVLLVIAQLIPFATLAGWTRRARAVVATGERRGPWWQRGRVDVIVAVVIGGFGWFVLQSQSIGGDLLDDPVVILLPAAITFASGLMVLRIVPVIASALAVVLDRSNATAALLAFRKAARMPASSAAPLLLLVLTGALSIYTASLARTIDLQLVDEAHHDVGGINRIDGLERTPPPNFGFALGEGPPVEASAFERIWGIETASRVASFAGRAEGAGGGDQLPIEVRAVDPSTFATASFWRADYATQSLGTLMERLSENRDGVLLRRIDMVAQRISLGDTVFIRASNGDVGIDLPMVVVGHYDQFPAWQPSEPLVPAIVSLPDLEQRLGTSLPSTVIYTGTDTSVGDGAEMSGGIGRDDGQTRADLSRLGLAGGRVQTAAERIEQAQLDPERQGVFGLLTVSFLLSSVLTVAGFVFYAIASSRRHLAELGILRATGLTQRSLFTFVALDLLIVAMFGIGAAVLIGATMSRLVLGRLVGTGAGSAPALLAEVDWLATVSISAALAGVFIVAAAALVGLLRRVRLFEAIKLGGGL